MGGGRLGEWQVMKGEDLQDSVGNGDLGEDFWVVTQRRREETQRLSNTVRKGWCGGFSKS